MAEAITLSQFNYRMEEQWNTNPGVPKFLTKKAGSGWATVKRTLQKQLSGRQVYHSPVTSSLPGAGGPNLSEALRTSSGIAGQDFVIKEYQDYRARAEWAWKLIFTGKQGANIYPTGGNAINFQLNGVASRTENLYSFWMYGDGGGAVCRLSDAALVVGQTVLNVKLPRSLIALEEFTENSNGDKEGGDTIEFSASKGTPGTGGSVRSFRTRIVAIRRSKGEIEIETPIPDAGGGVPLLQPDDYVFHAGMFSRAIIGLEGWNPSTDANLAVPFHEINRSRKPEKLAGLRIPIGATQDPYPQITTICKEAQINGSDFNRVCITPELWENFALAGDSLVRQLNGKSGPGMEIKPSYDANNVRGATWSYGFPNSLVFPNTSTQRPITVTSDEWLWDVDFGPEKQIIYRGWNDDDWKFLGSTGGCFTWVNLDGVGIIRQSTDKEIVSATYSVEGIFISEAPINMMVAGPEVSG